MSSRPNEEFALAKSRIGIPEAPMQAAADALNRWRRDLDGSVEAQIVGIEDVGA